MSGAHPVAASDLTAQVFRVVGVGVYLIDAEGLIVEINPTASAMLGWSTAQLSGLPAHEVLHASDVPAHECPIVGVTRAGRTVSQDSDVFRRSDGSLMPVWWAATPLPVDDGRGGRTTAAVVAFGDVTARHTERVIDAADRERTRADVVSAQQLASDLGWSAEVAHLMSLTGDEREALRRLARLAVPRLGDVAIVDLVDGSGDLIRLDGAVADGVDLDVQEILARPGAAHVPGQGQHTAATVRQSTVSHIVGDALTDPDVFDAPSRHVLAGVGAADLLVVPLAARDRLVGVIGLIRRHGSPAFTATDAALAADVGRRAGLVLDNARLNADRRTELLNANSALQRRGDHNRAVATALQQAMLTALPEPDQLQLVARYLPAARNEQVGGDWYDAIIRPGGATALMIGDTVGHDIHAAAVMGQLRSMLRAFAWASEEPPSVILGQLDRAMRDLSVRSLATAVMARVEPAEPDRRDRLLRWSNAGHPAPILLEADGTASVLDDGPAELVLGVDADRPRHDHTHLLTPGSVLVFYTDGLVETHDRDLAYGTARLVDSLRRHRDLDPDQLIDAVLGDLVGAQPSDDVAVLVVRLDLDDRTRPGETGRTRTSPPTG